MGIKKGLLRKSSAHSWPSGHLAIWIPYGNHYRAGIWPDGPFRRMGTDGPMGPMTMARWEPDGLEVAWRPGGDWQLGHGNDDEDEDEDA